MVAAAVIGPIVAVVARAIVSRIASKFISKSEIFDFISKYTKPSNLLKEIGIDPPGWICYIIDLMPINDFVDLVSDEIGRLLGHKSPEKSVGGADDPQKKKDPVPVFPVRYEQVRITIIGRVYWQVSALVRYSDGHLSAPQEIHSLQLQGDQILSSDHWFAAGHNIVEILNNMGGHPPLQQNVLDDFLDFEFVNENGIQDDVHFFPDTFFIPINNQT